MMNRFVVLLRGVMPTGKNRVPMAQLRQILCDDGFENVQTWIQSGNVLLETTLSAKHVAMRVHELIEMYIGATLKVIVKTPEEIKKILEENPFTNGYDISRVFFTLFNDVPDKKLAAELQVRDFGDDKLVVTQHAVYLYIPASFAKTKLSNNFLEKKLGIDATTRNFNTLSKMIELAKSSDFRNISVST